MIRKTDSYNTEDGNVGLEGGNVGRLLRSDRIEGGNDVTVRQRRFFRRELIVLISIVCLSLSSGITINLQNCSYKKMPDWVMTVWHMCGSGVYVAGSILAAFLSEVAGRKPVYIYLFAHSILSSILYASSQYSYTVIMSLTFFLQDIILGGTSVMNALTISEYSRPKYRFFWMIAHVASRDAIVGITDLGVPCNVLIVVQIVLGLMCLGSTWVWPESPYWLASKGKLEESRKAFLFLRGEESRKELRSVLEARRRPGPPRLFWTGLGLAIATLSVTFFRSSQDIRLFLWWNYQGHVAKESQCIIILVSSVVVFSVMALMSHFITRKLLFINISGIAFVFSYVLALSMYLMSEKDDYGLFFYGVCLVCDVITRCGLFTFCELMFIEIAPYKYNTVISCICLIVEFLFNVLTMFFHSYIKYDLSFNLAAIITLYTTISVAGALIYYFFAPETKDKTLLEIQSTYSPDENDSNHEQILSMSQNIT